MNFNKAIQSAFGNHKAKSLYQAATICLDLLEFQPDNVDALRSLAAVCYELGNYDLAITCLYKATELNPNDVAAYYNLGVAVKEKGQLKEAITLFQKVLELQPGNNEAR